MKLDLATITAFVTVARAGGFREGARLSNGSASRLSDQVRRLESQLGVRLFNRSTRSVALTEAGEGLLQRLSPALDEMELALDVVNSYRDQPVGTSRPFWPPIPVSGSKSSPKKALSMFWPKDVMPASGMMKALNRT